MKTKYLLAVLTLAAAIYAACSSTPSPLYSSKAFSEAVSCYADAGCTGVVPTSPMDAGVSLRSVNGFQLIMQAWASQTFNATGTLQAYFCDQNTDDGGCYRNPQLDQSVTCTGVNRCGFSDFARTFITEDADTLEFVPVGVGVNGVDGGPLTVRIYTHYERYK